MIGDDDERLDATPTQARMLVEARARAYRGLCRLDLEDLAVIVRVIELLPRASLYAAARATDKRGVERAYGPRVETPPTTSLEHALSATEQSAAPEPQGPELWGVVWGPAEVAALRAYQVALGIEAVDRHRRDSTIGYALAKSEASDAVQRDLVRALAEYESDRGRRAASAIVDVDRVYDSIMSALGGSPSSGALHGAASVLEDLGDRLLSGGDS